MEVRSRKRWIAAGALGVAAAGALALTAGLGGMHAGGTGTGSGQAAAASAPATVGTHSSKLGLVLAGQQGRTLYYLTSERHGAINCTGKCLQFWPPLLAAPGHAPTLAPGVAGTAGVITRPGGARQVTVNGMPLYYFAGDKQPGSANGQGLKDGTFGTWFVLRGSASPASTTPVTGGSGSHGYGY